MIVELFIFILTTLISYHFYTYKKIYNYFDKHGIKYCASVPLFGNLFNSLFARKHIIEDLYAVYEAFPKERYVGFAEGSKPFILIRDPELMKLITVKNFDHFTHRKQFLPRDVAPAFANSVSMMKAGSWRELRSKLSSTFTGSKMRHTLPLMTEISTNILKYLKDHQSEDINVTGLMRRYASDVIVSSMLGIKVHSEGIRNKFYHISQETELFTFKKRLIFHLALQSPTLAKVMKFLNITILSNKGISFFRDIVTSTIKDRKKNNVSRPDFVHFLMNSSDEWTPDAAAGQAYLAFLAGFEPSATNLTTCIYELAINPDVQEKLYQEIRANEEINGELTYDNVSHLKYLDCVFNENFRKWSAAVALDRVCTEAYVLPPPREGGKPFQVNPEDIIYNAVNPVHMDPKYHPDPEVFNPDRFSDENKHKMKPFTFMPFGMGLRSCPGMRFATLNIKLMLYHLILNFKVVKCAKTAMPKRLMANVFHSRTIGGTWVQFESRN